MAAGTCAEFVLPHERPAAMTQLDHAPAGGGAVDLLENAVDLSDDDHLAEETDKDAPDDADADLPEPDQDPNFVPVSAVDDNGKKR